MKKKAVVLAISASMVFGNFIPVYAADTIQVKVDGVNIPFDVPPQIVNNRTMVPMRAIFEKLQAEVQWDDASKTIVAKKGTTSVRIKIGDNILYVNNKPITLDSPAQVIQGRTMVPVRAISESFCLEVDWDWDNKVVSIEELSPSEVMHKAYNYMVGDIWNEGFCNIEHYLYDGTDYVGEPLDIDKTLKNLQTNYEKKASYDAYFENLDEFYGEVKNSWSNLSKETDRLYQEVITHEIKPGVEADFFNTVQFCEYRDYFGDL